CSYLGRPLTGTVAATKLLRKENKQQTWPKHLKQHCPSLHRYFWAPCRRPGRVHLPMDAFSGDSGLLQFSRSLGIPYPSTSVFIRIHDESRE
ncbi:hypothetical protein CH063_11887, partial [Colletotrichum higginsianum]